MLGAGTDYILTSDLEESQASQPRCSSAAFAAFSAWAAAASC